MADVPGMLTLEELSRRVKAGEIETVLLMFTDPYGRFMGKRLDADFFLEDGVKNGTHACDYLMVVDMEMDPVPGYKFANWEKGFGDFHLVPDMATLRLASWLESLGRAVVALTVFGSSAATGSDDHGLSARQPQSAPKRLALARGVGAEQHDAPAAVSTVSPERLSATRSSSPRS